MVGWNFVDEAEERKALTQRYPVSQELNPGHLDQVFFFFLRRKVIGSSKGAGVMGGLLSEDMCYFSLQGLSPLL